MPLAHEQLERGQQIFDRIATTRKVKHEIVVVVIISIRHNNDFLYSNFDYFGGGRTNPTGLPSVTHLTDASANTYTPLLQDHTAFRPPTATYDLNHGLGSRTEREHNNPSFIFLSSFSAGNVEGGNVGFYDGHVTWYPFDRMKDVGTSNGSHGALVYTAEPHRK